MNLKVVTGTIPVKNARIFYKISGEGNPHLLMITGGSGDADSYDAIIPYLADHYTIITYDRRGYTRSPINHLSEEEFIDIETQSNDASSLIKAVANEPVYIFGNSLGALIGLDLTIRFPSLVRKIIVHEPPLVNLLPESHREGKIFEKSESESPLDAIRRFTESFGMVPAHLKEQAIKPLSPEEKQKKAANASFFLEHETKGVGNYHPDMNKIRDFVAKIIFAAGRESKGNFLYGLTINIARDTGALIL